MPYNPHQHHRKSVRLKGYNYAQAGLYFLTICTHNRECLLGNINNGQLLLNDAGQAALKCWEAIPQHFPNAVVHPFVIMPNHVHGIIALLGQEDAGCLRVGAENFLPLHANTEHQFQQPIPRSIASIVKGFKIGVTTWCRLNSSIVTVWQLNYYDHIIRNDASYRRIAAYIENNPVNWEQDRFFVR